MKWKAAGVATLFFALATTSFGQGRFGERGEFGRAAELPGAEQRERGERPDPLVGLQKALGLHEAQVEAIRAARASQQESQQALNEQTRTARQALRTLIAKGGDPTAIGNATLALEVLGIQSQALRYQLRTAVRNTLTLSQQEPFDALEAVGRGRGFDVDGQRGSRGGVRGRRGGRGTNGSGE